MLLKLFKGSGPGTIFLIAATCIAVWVSAFIHPLADQISQSGIGHMPLYHLLLQIEGHNARIETVIALLLAGTMAFLLVNFNTTSFFINERTNLPALIYILAVSIFPEYQSLNPAIPASLFLMIAVMRIIDGYRKPGIANNFYDAGILISTGSLFYANLIWFGVIVIIGILLMRPINIAELALSIFGLLTPLLMTFGIWYVTGKDPKALMTLFYSELFTRSYGYFFSRLTVTTIILGSILIFVSLVFLMSTLNNKKIKSRKTFSLFIWLFITTVVLYIISPSVSVELIWIMAIPGSYFISHYFIFVRKKLIPEIFMSLFFLLVMAIQIYNLR